MYDFYRPLTAAILQDRRLYVVNVKNSKKPSGGLSNETHTRIYNDFVCSGHKERCCED